MAELRELLAAIPRPQVSHYRVRRYGRLRAIFRRALPFIAIFLFTYAVFAFGRVRTGLLAGVLAAMDSPSGLLAVFGLLFAYFLARNRALRRMVLASNEGALLWPLGRKEESVALYESLARRGRGRLPYHALFVGNRGVVAVLRGEPELGKQLLAEALRSGWLTRAKPSPAAGHFASWLARAYALENELRAARSWRELAGEFLPSHRRGMLLIADAIVLLRAGHAGAAADAISSGWMGAEGELPSHERRALRVLQAFGFVQSGRDAEAAAALAGLWPPIPNQLEYLGRDWPELNGFLITWKLARAA